LLSKIGALQSILSGGTNWATLDDTRKMAAKQAAEKLISEHLVAVFSKSYCPYCTQAKSVIAKLGLDQSSVGVLELDQMGSEGSDIQVSCAHTMKEKQRYETD
jgi:glutaredoxin